MRQLRDRCKRKQAGLCRTSLWIAKLARRTGLGRRLTTNSSDKTALKSQLSNEDARNVRSRLRGRRSFRFDGRRLFARTENAVMIDFRTPFALMMLCCTTALAADTERWIDLTASSATNSPVAGTWTKSGGQLTTTAAAASRLLLSYQPKTEYDFRVAFTRRSGQHSVALFIPVPGGQTAFDIDAWGQHLAGFQNAGGRSLQQREPRVQFTIENGRKYTALIEVRADTIRAFIDGNLIAEQATAGVEFDLPTVWQLPDNASLGLGAYSAETVFHSVEVRPVGDGRALLATARAGQRSPPQSESASDRSPQSASMTRQPRSTARAQASQKRVLIVIANQDFFYREYADPRAQLERAGIAVEVAAGRRTVCRPHANSGQRGDGSVMPDLALADVDVSRFDAIMFSGGWGSSMYQYAFPGRYRKGVYNGDDRTKEVVNRLLNEFVEQDKIIGALCHGISVLAWARVDGKSLLAGRRAVGSPRPSPAGTYPRLRETPLSRWNVQANGARITPMRSIGDPRTSADDVLVDGKLITGEDDNSADLFGRTLAEMLVGRSN